MIVVAIILAGGKRDVRLFNQPLIVYVKTSFDRDVDEPHKGVSGMKILVVEDSRFLRAAIERTLAKAGHEVISTADGREALLAARHSLPALILLDMMLPGLEGTCVLKELKLDASTSHIPVIVLTGLSKTNETKLKKAGAAAYIEKSSLDFGKDADVLVQTIASVLGVDEALVTSGQPKPTAEAEIATTEARLGTPGRTP